jgi:hypothetical protein
MAEADPLSRIKTAARRSAGPVAVEIQRDWYQSDLKHDLGLDAESNQRRDQAIAKLHRRANRPRFGLIVFIGLFAFFLFMMARLWWDGVLSLPKQAPHLVSKDWMRSRELPALGLPQSSTDATQKSDAPPSYFEPESPPKPAQNDSASEPDAESDEG